jgi:hypothetical protein
MPQVHTKDPLQSLLRMHVPPTLIFFSPPHPSASQAETTIKPRMRKHDADVSILQFCFAHRKSLPLQKYHRAGRSRSEPSGRAIRAL